MYKQETDIHRERDRERDRDWDRDRDGERERDRQRQTDTDRDREMIGRVKQGDDKLENYLDVVPRNRNKAMPSIEEKQTTSRLATLLFKNTHPRTPMLLSSIKHRSLTFCLCCSRASSVTPLFDFLSLLRKGFLNNTGPCPAHEITTKNH